MHDPTSQKECVSLFQTWALTFGGDAVVVFGVGADIGLAVSFPTEHDPDAEWDVGITGSVAGETGAQVGLGFQFFREHGSVADMGSLTEENTVSVGPVTFGNSTDLARSSEGTHGIASAELARVERTHAETHGRLRGQPRLRGGFAAAMRGRFTLSGGSLNRFNQQHQQQQQQQRQESGARQQQTGAGQQSQAHQPCRRTTGSITCH